MHVVSTNTGAAVGPTIIQQKQKNGNVLDVPCVEPVVDYNARMNAIDHSNQIRTTYAVAHSTKRWWLFIFWFLFGLALAFIRFKVSPNHKNATKDNNEKKATIIQKVCC